MKFFFLRFGTSAIVFLVFIVIGAIIGFLSGKERERYEQLREEKGLLEEDFEKVQEQLRKTEGRYRILFENISDAIYLTTDKGKFLLFNEAASLLSGYSREELRRLTLSQIQYEDEMSEDHHRAWLDNGICRYEERWRNKAGQILQLDINAKWMKIARVQCILHVARDVVHRKDALEEGRARDLVEYQKTRVHEISGVLQVFFRKVLAPMGATMDAVNRSLKQLPSEDAKFSPQFMEWEKYQRVIQVLSARTARCLDANPTNWNLNEVVRQELVHLSFLTGTEEILKKAAFSQEIPLLFTSGRELTAALEVLLAAVHESVPRAARKDMAVSTRMEDGVAVLQVQAPASIQFHFHLNRAVDPGAVKEEAEENRIGEKTLRFMLENLRYRLELEYPESGILARVKIPFEEAGYANVHRADRGRGGNPKVIL